MIRAEFVWLHAPGLMGEDDELHPVASPEFGHEPAHVRLCGRLRNIEIAGDLGVGATTGDKVPHLKLAGREILPAGWQGRGRRSSGVGLDKPARDRRRKQCVSRSY